MPNTVVKDQATIMMVTYNRLTLTKQTLDSLFESTAYPFSLVLIDNASSDDTITFLKPYLEEKLVQSNFFTGYVLKANDRNLGIGIGRNQALVQATGEWLVTMDNDVILPTGWLNECIDILKKNSEYVICGVNYEGVTYPFVLENGKEFQLKPNGTLGTACLVFNQTLHTQIGFFSTGYGLYGQEDADFCFRVRFMGYKLAYIKENGIHLGENETSTYRVLKNKWFKRSLLQFKINRYLYKLGIKGTYVAYRPRTNHL